MVLIRKWLAAGCAGIGLLLSGTHSLADEEEYPVEFTGTFRVLSWTQAVRDLRYRESEERVASLIVPNASISPEYRYAGPRDLAFFRETGVDEEGEPTYEVVARVSLPQGNNQRVLLLFFPDPDGLRIVPVKEDGRGFVNRGFRFFNLTDRRLGLRVGDQVGELAPRGVGELVADDTENKAVQIAIYGEEAWDLVYSSRWRPRDDRQILVFIAQPPDGKDGLSVRRFREAAPRR